MKYNIIHIHHGTLADEETKLTLIQFCTSCNIGPELVIEMVDQGILEPEGERRSAWRFSHDALENARKVLRLRRDLNLSLSGAALALELLGRIERLEAILERKRY